MANVYHNPDVEPKKETFREVYEPHSQRETDLTLERAAANANVLLVVGFNQVTNPDDEKKPFKQPFWFVHQFGEVTGIYVKAEATRFRDDSGVLHMTFAVEEAKEKLKRLLVAYYATGKTMGLSILQFGGGRGFKVKTAHPQPKGRKTQ